MVLLALALVTAGCLQPYDALDIGRSLARERVGSAYIAFDPGVGEAKAAHTADGRIVIVAFGCRGDYIDEIKQEDAEERDGKHRWVRFTNEAAMVIVGFTKPPTARESVVTQVTLDAL